MAIDKSLGFFDVDSLEYFANQSDCASILPHLSFRQRVIPLSPVLNGLYSYALSCGHPIIFSTCCSGRFPEENEISEVLHIPALDSGVCWRDKCQNYSFFLVEKFFDACPQLSFMEKMQTKFAMNQNFRRFVQALNVEEWVTFGNGASFCVYPALLSLLNAGEKVILLSDVLVDSDSGHSKDQALSIRQQMLEVCMKQGARVCSLQEFCNHRGISTHLLNFHYYSGNPLPLLEARRES